MAMRKPILAIGLGATALLGAWELRHPEQIAQWGLAGLVAVGSGLWWLKSRSPQREISFTPLTRERVESEIARSRERLDLIAREIPDRDVTSLHRILDSLFQDFDCSAPTVTLLGATRSGKTSLKALLEKTAVAGNIQWQESMAIAQPDPASPSLALTPSLIASDLLLFLTAGDLTDADWQSLRHLHQHHYPILLLLNKQDCYLPAERADILHQMRSRVAEFLPKERVLAIAAAPNPVLVRQHREDGTVTETREVQPVEIDPLVAQLTALLQGDRASLALGRLWRRARQVSWQAQTLLDSARRDRALPIIEKYQWLAAATAFANPLPSLDLLATAAINAQLIVDLGQLYRQKFSLDRAQTVAGTLGQLMVKLGLVEFSSQAVASLLKSHAATYVAGGTIQGISAAYLTRIAGLSLIDYFAAQSLSDDPTSDFDPESFQQKLQQAFAKNQGTAIFRDFAARALQRLPGKSPSRAIATS